MTNYKKLAKEFRNKEICFGQWLGESDKQYVLRCNNSLLETMIQQLQQIDPSKEIQTTFSYNLDKRKKVQQEFNIQVMK